MLNKKRLQEILTLYKADFADKTWVEEKFKWVAVMWFQKHWNIDAKDFPNMLKTSLAKAKNLLDVSMYYPAATIVEFAGYEPLMVKNMFIDLFDDNIDICSRVSTFKQKSDELLKKYGKGAKNHYQTENSIFTYLWLHYPDKYYIYKFREVKAVADELGSDYVFKQGAYDDNIRNFLAFYDEINSELKQDSELKLMLNSQIDDECYVDNELRTLTIDVGYYISRTLHAGEEITEGNDSQNKQAVEKDVKAIPNFWKISHGLDFFSNEELEDLADRKVVVVHKDTSGKGRSKISQGEDFVNTMKKGDIFYLCYGNSIRFLGRITTDNAKQCPTKAAGWVERGYSLIAKSIDNSSFKGDQKWWAPNDRSTCMPIKEKDMDLFEKNILTPYFNMTLKNLLDDKAFRDNTVLINSKVDLKKLTRNRIIFGAPGTGKSYKLEQERKDLLVNGGEYERVTFHPDYSYANFVGTYKPVMVKNAEGKKEISYEYVPGPFLRVLVKALKNSKMKEPKPYLLIIEEINRANVAAVFGDVFQLLDRDSNGVSEFAIATSEDMRAYLAEELGVAESEVESIMIPNNMFIWATMNSADQGVYPMDTAFKRRWEFEYISIDAKEDAIEDLTFKDARSDVRYSWNKLRKAINSALIGMNVNEDKLLGPFFLHKSAFADDTKFAAAFKSKVLMYLFEDAARQKRKALFSGCDDFNIFSRVCEQYDKIGVAIFGKDFADKVPVLATDAQEEREEQ